MSTPITGSCVCGAVRYTVEPPFIAFQLCHCSRCRKAAGSDYLANLFVPVGQITFEGEEHVRRFELPTARYWCSGWCDRCGSNVPWRTRTDKAWVVPAGGLDEHPGVTPERRIFFGSRAPWHVCVDDLPTFEGFPPRP